VLDRGAIEKLFEIQRRTALLLMKQAGTVKAGVHFLVPRQVLIRWVERIEATEGQELGRRRRVAAPA